MRNLRRRLAGLVLAPVLCRAADPQAAATPLANLLADYDAAWLVHEPHLATSLGDRRYDDRLADRISPAWLTRDRELAEQFLARLDALGIAHKQALLPQLQAHIVAEPQQSVLWKPLAALSGAERRCAPRHRARAGCGAHA